MKAELLLRAILPDVLIDNFDIVDFNRSSDRFDIFLDEKKIQPKEDRKNPEIIAYGFGEYRVGAVQPSSMSANVNGLTKPPMKFSVTTGTYQNLTVHGSMQSSFLF